VTVGERFDEYGAGLVKRLRGGMVRAEMDPTSDTMGKKIRNAVTSKIPNVVVVGEREMEDGTVTLRRYGVQEQETMPFAAFEERLLAAIRTRSPEL
ncbi:MAG: His/Gly/Thr/Pro-type tRNA ligase C-terminal domain-containing protein, partial [Myxococcota bacterium]